MAPPKLHLCISLLGKCVIHLKGQPLSFPTNKACALLIYLALTPNQDHQRSAIAGIFWPDKPTETALTNLRQTLKLLRQTLGPEVDPPILRIGRQNIMLRETADLWIDVSRFEALSASAPLDAAAAGAGATIANGEQALRLYAGDLLGDTLFTVSAAFDDLIVAKRSWLLQTVARICEQLVACCDQERAPGQLLAYTQRWLEIDPWSEQAHYWRIRALAVSDQRRAAFAHYDRYCASIAAELGLEPAAEIERLIKSIGGGFQAARAPRSALPEGGGWRAYRPLQGLPAPTTSFVGRQSELAALRAMLGDTRIRLITLTGPGGAGKTRLALHSAAQVAPGFRDGVSLISLAQVTDSLVFASTLAHALGLQEISDEPLLEQLRVYLRDRHQLLLLDNMEQLLAGAELISDLLAAAPGLTVLITSRVRLNLYGEHEFSVAPLPLPTAHIQDLAECAAIPSIALFLDRVHAVVPGFSLTPQNRAAVVAICIRLDGLPLALELAAPQLKFHPPEDMLGLLDASLLVLTDGPRNLPVRQQTLRSTIDWSYRLLEPDEQELFIRLAVFCGGADAAAVEALCGYAGFSAHIPAGAIKHLIDKNMLLFERGADRSLRFFMLETIREYALEQLAASGELEGMRRRHALYYAVGASGLDHWYVGTGDKEQLRHYVRNRDNIRAALEWLLAHDELAAGLDLINGLWLCWYMGGFWREGYQWMRRFINVAGAAAPLAARFYWRAAFLAWSLGLYQETVELARQGLAGCAELLDQRHALLSMCLLTLGTLYLGDLDQARSLGESALALSRQLNLPAGIANALITLGHVAWFGGDVAWSCAIHEESLKLASDLKDQLIMGFSLTGLERALLQQGRVEEVGALALESHQIFLALGDRRGMAKSLLHCSQVASARQRYAQAGLYCAESLAFYQAIADRRGIATCLTELGLIAFHQQHLSEAQRLHEESLTLSREIQDQRRIAITLANLALVVAAQDQIACAHELYCEALLILRGLSDRWQIVVTLERVALQFLNEGYQVMAVRLLGAVAAMQEQLWIAPAVPPAPQVDLAWIHASPDWQHGRTLTPSQAIDYALITLAATDQKVL